MHTVLILDDHAIVRLGLETLFSACADFQLVGSAPGLAEGLELIERHRPDLVVSDMTLQDSKGLDTVRAVIAAQQGRHVLVVSMHDETLYGEQVLGLGARGYVMKENAHAVIVAAARSIFASGSWVSPKLNTQLLGRLARRTARTAPPGPAAGMAELSLRELEVLELLRGGSTTKEIARRLDLSIRTVDNHRASIKRKLGLRSGAEVIAFASSKT